MEGRFFGPVRDLEILCPGEMIRKKWQREPKADL